MKEGQHAILRSYLSCEAESPDFLTSFARKSASVVVLLYLSRKYSCYSLCRATRAATGALRQASLLPRLTMRIAIAMLAAAWATASPDPSYPSDGRGLSEVDAAVDAAATAFGYSRRLFAGEQQWNDTVPFYGKRRGVGRHGRSPSPPGKMAGRGRTGHASFRGLGRAKARGNLRDALARRGRVRGRGRPLTDVDRHGPTGRASTSTQSDHRARHRSPMKEDAAYPLRPAVHSARTARVCTIGEILGVGAWRTDGANGGPTWRPVAGAACSMVPLPRRLSVTFVGDSHLREMMLGLCKLRRGLPRPACSTGPLCELSWSCHTTGLRLSWVAKLSVRDSSPAFEPRQPCVPDVVVLDSLHWDVMALVLWSNSVLATQLRATSRQAVPGALVQRVAAEWEANCSAYVARTQRAYAARAARSHASCPDSAGRGYGHAPLLVWATTHAIYTPAAFAAGVRSLDGETHSCLAHCTTQSEHAAAFARHAANHSERACCQPLSFKLVAALNERARRVARAHGMLLLDVERMMRPLPLAKTLWDAAHLHHNYSEPLGQLVLAAAAVALQQR